VPIGFCLKLSCKITFFSAFGKIKLHKNLIFFRKKMIRLEN
jgi:hypothetical protein